MQPYPVERDGQGSGAGAGQRMGAEQRAVHRLAEQIALTEAAAGLAQEVSLRRGFDTLGNDRGTVQYGQC